jgi:hypothetical protein
MGHARFLALCIRTITLESLVTGFSEAICYCACLEKWDPPDKEMKNKKQLIEELCTEFAQGEEGMKKKRQWIDC